MANDNESLGGRYWHYLLVAELLMLPPAVWVVFNNAGGEPFIVVRATDVWTQVALPALLAALRVELVIVLAYLWKRHRNQRARTAGALLWCLFVLFWLVETPKLYISDIVRSGAEYRAMATECTKR